MKLHNLKLINYSYTRHALNTSEEWELLLDDKENVFVSSLLTHCPSARCISSISGPASIINEIKSALLDGAFLILREKQEYEFGDLIEWKTNAEVLAGCKKCGGTGKVTLFRLPQPCECQNASN